MPRTRPRSCSAGIVRLSTGVIDLLLERETIDGSDLAAIVGAPEPAGHDLLVAHGGVPAGCRWWPLGRCFLDLVKSPLLAGRQAHHAVPPEGSAEPPHAGPGGRQLPVLRGAPPGWFHPRCPPAWLQERRTGSSRGRRKGRRPPSPLRPAAPSGLLPPRWERTTRDPPAGRRRATSSSGSALRSLQAAPQAPCGPAQAPSTAGRGAARRHMTEAGAECLQHLGHVRTSGSMPKLATGVWSGSTLRS
jgi:hypothetical protein